MTGDRRFIRSVRDMARMVEEYGFLPFFSAGIPGFSIEEHTPSDLYFVKDVDGPWEWKGPVIRMTGAAYGKFFSGKAGYIRADLFTHFANYRRDGYDIDARFADGLARKRDLDLVMTLDRVGPCLSKRLRLEAGYGRRGGGEGHLKGFDTAVTRMQMQCYILTSDFVYMTGKDGVPYGWGVAEYSTPEQYFGEPFAEKAYSCTPEDSYAYLFDFLREKLPEADEKHIRAILG